MPRLWDCLARAVAVMALCLTLGATHAAPPHGDASFDFSQYEGKVVVLDFWASWCGPCRRSFPWFNEMQKKYGAEGLVIVGVNNENDRPAADKFLEQYPADFQILFDPQGELAQRFGVTGMPTTFVFNRVGEPVAKHLGFQVQKLAEYELVLIEVLRQPNPSETK